MQCFQVDWLTKDTENLKEQFIMAITLTPKPEASTSNYPKNIGIVITGLGNIAAALLCPPWLDLRAESRLSPLYTFEVFQKRFLELDQQSPIPQEQTSGLK
ncbi:hypothetical protein F2P79_007678 [Pimephales promelas]|nr:hypothetical protein F2P79_007678 [Pimephales promelas]